MAKRKSTICFGSAPNRSSHSIFNNRKCDLFLHSIDAYTSQTAAGHLQYMIWDKYIWTIL